MVQFPNPIVSQLTVSDGIGDTITINSGPPPQINLVDSAGDSILLRAFGSGSRIQVTNASGNFISIESSGSSATEPSQSWVNAATGASFFISFDGAAFATPTMVQRVSNGAWTILGDLNNYKILNSAETDGIVFDPATKAFLSYHSSATETWHTITLQNGWVARGVSWSTPSYRLMPDGTVALKGQMSGGTTADGTKIGTLPVGYRPPEDDNYPITSFTGSNDAILEVQPNGDMFIFNAGAAPLTVGLGGVRIPLF